MSKEFGLDWQKHDSIRMEHFIEIMRLEAAKSNKDQKSADKKNQFRKRM